MRVLKQGAALDNVGGPEDAGGVRDEFGVRGSLALDLSANVELLLRAQVETDRGVNSAPRNSALTLGDHQISVGADCVRDTDNNSFGASAEVTAGLDIWRIVSLTSFEGFGPDYGFDFDGQPAAIATLSYDRDYFQLAQELYGRTSWDGGDLLLGLSWSIDDCAQDYLIWCGVLNPGTLVGTCTYPGAPRRATWRPPTALSTSILAR